MGRMKPTFLSTVALGVALLLLPLPGAFAQELPPSVLQKARQEGEVAFYTSFPVWFTDLVIPKFEQRYGIKVRRFRGSATKVVQKFFAERERGVLAMDVIESTYPAAFHEMKRRGWIGPAMKELPVWGDFPEAVKDKDGHWLPSRVLAVGIYINTKLIPPDQAPRRWADLGQPQWKGRIALGDPIQCGGCVAWVIFALSRPELGEDFLRKLRANLVTLYPEGGASASAMYSGQKAISTSYADYHPWFARMKRNVPTAVIYPPEGFPIITSPLAIARGAPHPNAAKVWANYLLGPESQEILVRNGVYTANRRAPQPTYKPPYDRGGWEPPWGELAAKGEVERMQQLAARILRGR